MSSGRVFWGVLFVVVGLLFLVDGLLPTGLDGFAVWKLWPLVLVMWGLAKIIEGKWIKVILAAASALLIGVLIHGLVTFAWVGGGDFDDEGESYTEEFSVPFDRTTQRASLSMDFGAGVLSIREQTDDLLAASTSTTFGRYSLEQEGTGDQVDLRLDMEGRRAHWPVTRMHNKAEVRLHPLPTWDLDIDCGAARAELDLRPFRVDKLRMDAGAANVRIILGELSPVASVKINAGASSLRIEVPESAGCEIRSDGGVTRKRFSGFERINDNTYRTSNFDDAPGKIYIDLDTGVSSIRVVRY